MSDELVKRLREWRNYSQKDLSLEAADRIEALTAERDHAWAMVEKADTQMGQSLADHLQAKAERDRLRAAIETISYYNTVGYTDMALDAASAALKGESHD